MDYAIEIDHLTKHYPDFTLNDITLHIPSGSIVGVIGENGAGKSTLIRSMLGIIHCDAQHLQYFGQNFRENEKEIKEQIAVIFDHTHFNQKFTPKFIGSLMSRTYRNWNMETYQNYLSHFHIPPTKRLEKFSRGMKMKLEFAIAFSHDARLLILDEATSGLDPIVRDDVLSMIRTFTEEEDHTVLMSSHITSDLDKIADYIAYIHEGRLVFMKSCEEIQEDHGVIHAGKNLLTALNSEDVIAYIKEPYSYSILISHRSSIQQTFPDLEIQRPSVEELMLFYAKGEKK